MKEISNSQPSSDNYYKLEYTAIHRKKWKTLEQDTIQAARNVNIILTGSEGVCLARIMSNERRAVTAPVPKGQCEQVHGIRISLTQ